MLTLFESEQIVFKSLVPGQAIVRNEALLEELRGLRHDYANFYSTCEPQRLLSNHPLRCAFLSTRDFIAGVQLCCRIPNVHIV
jgi:hypothetical protein